MPILRLVVLEIQHRMQQLDELGLLSPSIRRFLLDENIPGASLTLVPELTPGDFFKLLENPTKEAIDYWILKGERSVWPAVTALKIRCAIEKELDRGYQLVRRRKPSDDMRSISEGALRKSGSHGEVGVRKESEYYSDEKSEMSDRRRRARSLGEGVRS
jgi:TAG lipase/lysophosphatidylethanolamine acyltransferase